MRYFFLLLLLLSCSQLPKKRTDKLSILQGVTTPKEVQFSVLAPKEKILRFELQSAEGEILKPDETKIISRPYSPYVLHKMIFQRDAKKEFNLFAFEAEKIIDQRLVGKGQLQESRLRLAVASCMDDHYEAHFKIWNALAAKNPEYLILTGDNVYADKSGFNETKATDPEFLWKRYTDVRLTLPLYFQEKLIPVHATWDDHDYGINDGDENFKYKTESKEIFEAFFAQEFEDEDFAKGLGIGSVLTQGDFNLYFLDGRSFRATSPEGKHLGSEQETWLVNKLKEEDQPSFIIMGDQFFGGYHKFDSFEGKHPQDFEHFVSTLKELKTPFIFLSGDRHMSEIMQFPRGLFGKPSFEITSSPMHGKLYPPMESPLPNPWRVISEDAHMNFTIIDNSAKNDHWFMDVESIGENGEIFYRRELAVYIKDLQNNLNEVRKRRSGKRRYHRAKRRR
jgi:alkaline phosphatase D